MTVVVRRPAGRMLAGTAVLAILLVGGCSSDESPQATSPVATTAAPIPIGEAPLRVELVREAMAAVDAALGGPQQYFEVNASPTVINLFVAASDATEAIAYVYVAGALEPPAEPEVASGPTFAAADVDFDETTVLAAARSQLPSSDFRLFAIGGVDGGGVRYQVVVDSTQGTEFVVYLGPTGAILGTDQNLGVGSS